MNEKWYNQKIKGIPKSEKICLRHYTEDKQLTHIITIDPMRNYKLYEYKNNQALFTKHKCKNPIDLEEHIYNT